MASIHSFIPSTSLGRNAYGVVGSSRCWGNSNELTGQVSTLWRLYLLEELENKDIRKRISDNENTSGGKGYGDVLGKLQTRTGQHEIAEKLYRPLLHAMCRDF